MHQRFIDQSTISSQTKMKKREREKKVDGKKEENHAWVPSHAFERSHRLSARLFFGLFMKALHCIRFLVQNFILKLHSHSHVDKQSAHHPHQHHSVAVSLFVCCTSPINDESFGDGHTYRRIERTNEREGASGRKRESIIRRVECVFSVSIEIYKRLDNLNIDEQIRICKTNAIIYTWIDPIYSALDSATLSRSCCLDPILSQRPTNANGTHTTRQKGKRERDADAGVRRSFHRKPFDISFN